MFLLQANTTELFDVADLRLIAPELILTVCACVALVMEVVLPQRLSRRVGHFALLALGLAAASLLVAGWPLIASAPGATPSFSGFYDTIRLDGFAVVFKLIVLISAALAVALSLRYLDTEGEQRGEFYALVLFATVGMMFLASGYDLLVLYISLELMAVTFYVLVAYARRDRRSNEAGMKYFLLGAFSSGVLLYGMSLLFGVAGSTNLGDIGQGVGAALRGGTETSAALRPMLLVGMIAVAAGLFFKISAVPFHMWAPDAYQGAPTPVTAFLSTGSKAASFALLARVFVEALGPMRVDWAPLVGLVAAVTILVGNWAAVTQDDAKRLLAYSSISNAGYLLLGVVAGNEYGYTGLAFYLLAYTFMNAGAFGVVVALTRRAQAGERVEDFAGLHACAPGAALMMTIFLLSLGGLPLTGGFVGKWFLFGGLLQAGAREGKNWYYWLAAWAAVNTVVSFYYYARFIRAMYLTDARAGDARTLQLASSLRAALVVCAVGTILLGVYPQPFIRLAGAVVSALAAGGALALK